MGRRRGAVTLDELSSLVGHTPLDGDSSTQGAHALNVPGGYGLGVVEPPPHATPALAEHSAHFVVNLFKDVKESADRLVVGGVEAKGPTILHQESNRLGHVTFHALGQIRPGLEKVLEVSSGEHQTFARTIEAQPLVAVAGLHHRGPATKVIEFVTGLLGVQVI